MTALSSKSRGDVIDSATLAQPAGIADAWQLSNGRYAVGLNPDGSGHAVFLGQAVTRPSSRPLRQLRGFFIYLRDLDTGRFWSSTLQPAVAREDRADARATSSSLEFALTFDAIDTHTTVWIPSGFDAELRTCRITNSGTQRRRLELTSYAELVLGDAVADGKHPAFSKLFLETSYCPQRSLLWSRRRPRDAHQECISAAHLYLGESPGKWNPVGEFETDRARFIGRGHSLDNPRAMLGLLPLSATVGSVLDPIFSLRRSTQLEPGETVEITWAMLAAADQSSLWRQVDLLRSSWNSLAAPQSTKSPTRQVTGPSASNGMTSLGPPAVSANNQVIAKAVASSDAPWQPVPTQRVDDIRTNPPAAEGQATAPSSPEPLQFFNGLGGFSVDGSEYVIRLLPDEHGALTLPPMPWANVIANPQLGFIVSETGASCTWAANSRENRLTPWANDPISDPHGEALYLRDEDRQLYWSPLPGPIPHPSGYEVRHGFGYTTFRLESEQLCQEVTQFVPPDDPVKISTINITNLGTRPRQLSLLAYQRWDLGGGEELDRQPLDIRVDVATNSIRAANRQRSSYAKSEAFSCLATDDKSAAYAFCTDAASFLGPLGSTCRPVALGRDRKLTLEQDQDSSAEPCAALQLRFELAPGQSIACVALLGEAASEHAATQLIRRYGSLTQCTQALASVRDYWHNLCSALQIETPSQPLNLLVNGWLPYQNLSGRIWGRSSLYQSGGAFGFRDQLQDSAALVYQQPQLTRRQIVLHAAHQFVEGDVMHWWHPPVSRGIRTRFADDLLWLPCIAAEYAHKTGDAAIWDEPIRFLKSRPLHIGETEAFLEPADSGFTGTLYDHCCRAIDASLPLGAHGLPLMGCGDWNDGMNRVGVAGSGESVWLGFFLCSILNEMIPVCRQQRDEERAGRYQQHRENLRQALNHAGWDGQWYRRAFFDDGAPLGSQQNDECRIDTLAQAWAILSGVAPTDRAACALQAVEQHLVCEDGGLIRLLAPPFDKTKADPGYIKGYLPGIRENGGQYTHGVLWYIRALATLGHGTRAAELLDMLCPINHARSPQEVAVYQVEPYVVAADVYGVEPHVGRGGWSWYTGSAGWMFRVAVESLLGLSIEHGRLLVLNPCISAKWPSCRLRYRLPDEQTVYDIRIENPQARQQGLTSAQVDGKPAAIEAGVARIPLARDGTTHRVLLSL